MSLEGKKFLFLDCQTTGMRPPAAHLLEIAWSDGAEIESQLVALPEGATIPARVSEITGLRELSGGLPREEVRTRLRAALEGIDALVIHYAQFEKPFLADLLGELPVPVLCTYQLIKRLFPSLPSQNIRATAGFFGPPVIGHNRAGTFVRATLQIWQGLQASLADASSIADVQALLARKAPKKANYEYRLEKIKRLELPDKPGVYRMLGQTGEVLYVGKATSLKRRVNSYFRGQKNRDTRKLEMLAQVWDLQVTPCESPLEAALLESDEIKRLDPPYNVVFKTGRRHLVFYTREFKDAARTQDDTHKIGPFKHGNMIESLRALVEGEIEQIFYEPLPPEDVARGLELFLEAHDVDATDVRALLAYGLRLHRAYIEPEEVEDEVEEAEDEDTPVTPEEIAGKFERLLRQAGAEYARTRRLTRLLNARVHIGERTLEFRRGQLSSSDDIPAMKVPWAGLEIDTYDRMSILLSEVERFALKIEVNP